MTHQTKNPVDIDSFHQVKATLCIGKCGNTVTLEQENGSDQPDVVILHPLQLRHFAERFAGMEPAGCMTPPAVKTLSRRLRTLAFHIDLLYDYIKNHSDHRHADLSFELVKVTALSEMADEFCADLADDDTEPQKPEAPAASTTATSSQEAAQPSLI